MIQIRIDMKKTGQNIRRLFWEKGVSPKDLSEMGIVTQQAVYKWFRGETIPSIDNMIILVKLLGISSIDRIIVTEEGNAERRENDDQTK